jgi:hypothetical protein
VFPDSLAPDRWTPIVLELDAPEKTQALQVAIAFEPMGGDGDKKRQFPVLVDDAELVRVAALSAKEEAGDVGVRAGFAPGENLLLARRFTTRHLGDTQNDYWPDDPKRPAEPQQTKGAQSFVLKKRSELWMVDFHLSNSYGDKIKHGVEMRLETSADTKDGPVPSGGLAWPGATASVPAMPWSGKYVTFTFKERAAIPPGRYWIVLSKKPEDDPAQHVVYGIHGVPLDAYADGGYAEWEKETTNGFDGKWKPYGMNASFQVLGRVME